MIISRGWSQKGRRRISELQSSANHNLRTQAALQPTHSNMESPSIGFLLLNSHDKHHDIAIDGWIELNRLISCGRDVNRRIEESAHFSTRIFPDLEPWCHNSMNTVIQGRKRAETKMQDCLLLVPGYGNSTSGVKSEGSPADRVSLMILDMSLHCIPCLFLKDCLRYWRTWGCWWHRQHDITSFVAWGKGYIALPSHFNMPGPSIFSNQSIILNNTNRYFYRNSHSISYKPWIFRDSPFLLALTAPRYVAKTCVF